RLRTVGSKLAGCEHAAGPGVAGPEKYARDARDCPRGLLRREPRRADQRLASTERREREWLIRVGPRLRAAAGKLTCAICTEGGTRPTAPSATSWSSAF